MIDSETVQTKSFQSRRRLLVVDFHPIVCRGFQALLQQQNDLELCGAASTLHEARRLVLDVQPDLVIVELCLPDGNGLELIKELAAMNPALRIMVFSSQEETLFADRAIRSGAHGYLCKTHQPPEILEAIRRVLDDRVYLSEQMTDRMMSRMVGMRSAALEAASPIDTLSDRELEVFEMIGRGVTTRQIAESLQLSRKTVETYRENIKLKLNLRNGPELMQQAVVWVMRSSNLS